MAQRRFLLTVLAGGAISFVLSEMHGMREFGVLAWPGVVVSLAMRTDLRISPFVLVFLGNWIVYSVVVGLVLAIVRKARGHGDG